MALRPFLLRTVVVGAQGTVIATTTPRSPFATKALEIVSNHHIVKSNPYTEWFATGDATIEQAQELVQQFSVFSNLFLLAQLNKVINAPTLDEMREGKEILANEIGVVFKPKSKRRQDAHGPNPNPNPSPNPNANPNPNPNPNPSRTPTQRGARGQLRSEHRLDDGHGGGRRLLPPRRALRVALRRRRLARHEL